ncbi:hypothetical protein [Ochrobactrum sp. Marseille-Q0166]|uniref:hypothetical protein n=1 Tax=Ochrobactrum sp. Marseille-Q0166 TaxID=2761105 RepID=UPI001655A532|nr:hypothetical protein [Ochrobactrum sp. Marseille-Q0166]MBC8719180.1 hypothetical protein [Ochrobactrum sp. Marseille-Q0166]
MTSKNAGNFQKIESLLIESLNKVSEYIDDKDHKDVQEYINHQEYGVAWELLWCILVDKQVIIPESMRISGRMMGLGTDQ